MIKDIYIQIKYFLKGLRNFWEFRKLVFHHKDWDYSFSLRLFGFGLKRLGDFLEKNGTEVEETRMLKVSKIKRAVEIIKAIEEDTWLSLAEEKLGKKIVFYQYLSIEEWSEENRDIIDLAKRLENEWTDELFGILKGNHQDKKNFDGSGLFGWWD